MKVVTAEQMRNIDETAIRNYGIPALLLMNNAGKALADYIIKETEFSKIAVFAGSGNNGGDGFAAAFYLHNAGFTVNVYFDDLKKAKLSSESEVFYKICKQANILHKSECKLSSYDVVIDALCGTGIQGELKESLKQRVTLINSASCFILSADIPSGLVADGKVQLDSLDSVVHADATVTFGLPKINLVTEPGKSCTGKLVIADIGFPKNLLKAESLEVSLFENSQASGFLDIFNNPSLYKNKAGKVAVIGGFPGYEGASILAISGCTALGNGMSYLLTPEESCFDGRVVPPEVMHTRFTLESFEQKLMSKIERIDTLLIGPGLGREAFSQAVFERTVKLLEKSSVKNLIIDGDGLFFLASKKDLLNNAKCRLILTPHTGEASLLLQKKSSDIDSDRVEAARKLSLEYNATVVLKGPSSVTALQNRAIINSSGNSMMATAGMGDVLAGMTASLCGKLEKPLDIVSVAAYLHGACADWVVEHKKKPLCAYDIPHFMGEYIKETFIHQA